MSTPAEPPFPSHAPDGEEGAADGALDGALDGAGRPARVEGHALGSHRLGSHRLGPHVVGQRVVVRRLLPGETGPTGGPAFTDTLGECVAWGPDTCTVRTAEGTVVTIRLADVVSGKPVPPRASVRMRVPARTLHLATLPLLDGVRTSPVGDWLLRTGGTAVDGRPARRGNSVLAMNPTGTPVDDAMVARTAAEVREHYVALGLPPLAQVVADSPEEAALLDLGWTEAGGWAEAQVAPLARVQRYLPSPPAEAEVDESGPVVVARIGVARIGTVATVRIAVDSSPTDPWACLGDLWVAPAQRRTGLARAVLAEAVDWAAAAGTTTLHLQVGLENQAALALYRQIGFTAHHRYHYLTLD